MLNSVLVARLTDLLQVRTSYLTSVSDMTAHSILRPLHACSSLIDVKLHIGSHYASSRETLERQATDNPFNQWRWGESGAGMETSPRCHLMSAFYQFVLY